MALYTNVAKVRKLVSVRRVRTWINPGEQVDLDPSDVRHLGGNSAYIQLADGKMKGEKPPKEDKAPVAEKKNPPKETKSDKIDKKQIAADRKALKESLEGMTKVRIIEVAETVVGIDVLSRDKKADLIKQVLNASKEKGYAYVLKNS